MSYSKNSPFVFVFLLLIFAHFNLNAQNSALKWAKSSGGTSNDEGLSIFVDNSGNIYTTGYFRSTVDFDPGSGIFNLTSAGAEDIFVQKLDSSGNFLWAKSFGGTSQDEGLSIVVDESGSVYITGSFRGTADFDPGSGVFNLSASGFEDIFILKLDALGNFVWAKSFGDTNGDIGNSITVDASGNIYTIGIFEKTIDFDPGPGTAFLSAVTFSDVFILKLDAMGNYLWAKSFGGSWYDEGRDIEVDGAGNVIAIGDFNNTVDFDPGAATFNLTSIGSEDIFILKLDSLGNFIWAKSFGGTFDDRRGSISLDNTGNIYATGIFDGSVDFNPGAGIFNMTTTGNEDAFILKLNSSGNFQWAKKVGGSNFDEASSIDVDASGNIYTTGYMAGTVDIEPGPGVTNVSGGFVQVLNAAGSFIWATSLGSNCFEVKAGTLGTFYTTGYFTGTRDFNPGPGIYNLTSEGTKDIYIVKFGPCINTSAVESITTCNNYTWSANGQTYSNSGTFNLTLTNGTGCDSVVTLNLTINNSTSSTINESACFSYISPSGNVFTSNGTYFDTLVNNVGCDSIITINLTILNSSSTINPTSCDSYLSPSGNVYTSTGTYIDTIQNSASCDSIITINLTITNSSSSNISPAVCGSYTSPSGNIYISSGTYFDTIPNNIGCDSIITINLSILQASSSTISPSSCISYLSPSGNTYTSSGTYTDTISNSAGCDSIITINLTINQLPSFISTGLVGLTCFGQNTGKAIIIPTAGPAPYSYSWSGPSFETGPFQQNLLGGTYQVTMTDANGCMFQDSIIISSPPEIQRSYNIFSPTCGNYNGAIDLTASGGTGTLSYQWNSGSISQDINSINAGFYSVTITDQNGCNAIEPIPVSSQGGPVLTVNSITPVSCFGQSDGAVDISIAGIYQVAIWANGNTSEDLTNVPAGPYHLIIADTLSGCVSVLNTFVPQPNPISINVNTTLSICNDSTGTASLNVIGGNGGGTTTWSTGSTGNSIANLSAGIYSLNYADSKGCFASQNFTISDDGAPLIFLDTIIDVPCGALSGEIQITSTGNTTQNTYLWNTGASTEDLLSAIPGTYSLRVAEPGGCESFFIDDVEQIAAGNPNICLVRFDSITGYNSIIWEQTSNNPVLDHYSIYRETSQAGFYQKIGDRNAQLNGVYIDTISDPLLNYYRYKVSITDSCGVESFQSAHQKTVHLVQAFGVIPNTINLNWDNFEGGNVNTWYIYRNSQAQGWELIDSVSGTSFSYTDQPNFSLGDPGLFYVVKADHNTICNTSSGNSFDMIRSNNSNNTFNPVGLESKEIFSSIQVYPNPTDRFIRIISNGLNINRVSLLNYSGIKLMEIEEIDMDVLDISSVHSGVYLLKIETSEGISFIKILKE